MRVLVAGASGAIGSRLVHQLVERGHDVVGTHRRAATAEAVERSARVPVALDLLDARAVRAVVIEAQPDAIVHQATALADVRFARNFDRTFEQTNRLRTEGTDALLAAARAARVERFVAQSFASMRYVREGGYVKTEDDPLDPRPAPAMRAGEAAVLMGTESRGASNAKARRELGLTPGHASWRTGFAAVYAPATGGGPVGRSVGRRTAWRRRLDDVVAQLRAGHREAGGRSLRGPTGPATRPRRRRPSATSSVQREPVSRSGRRSITVVFAAGAAREGSGARPASA